jgi:hypothetical protein
MLTRRYRRTAWIAMFAILLNGFAPAVSHALAARLGVTWLEICTPDGLKRVAVRYEGARPDLPPGAHVAADDHCPYCTAHGSAYAFTPPTASALPILAGPAEIVVSSHTSARGLATPAGWHARAPPSFA